jgi:hypothetical protein
MGPDDSKSETLRKLIYIAGPFRGPTPLDVRRNVERARDVGFLVAQAGAYPVIPHMLTAEFDKQLDDQFWLDGTLELLRRCDGIFLVDGWKRSTAAAAEVADAMRRGQPIFETIVSLQSWLAQEKAAARAYVV